MSHAVQTNHVTLAPHDREAANNLLTKLGGIPTLRYFDLKVTGGFAGRGGAVRLFFMAAGIPYKDQIQNYSDWVSTDKAKVTEHENPCGHLPIVYIGDKVYVESHAILRHFSRLLGLYGVDPEHDYKIDVIADACVEWRSTVLDAVFGDDHKKASYRDHQRAKFHHRTEALARRFGSPGYSVGHQLTFPDALIYALMWDEQGTWGPLDLTPYPSLAALFMRFGAIPEVQAWCAEMRAHE